MFANLLLAAALAASSRAQADRDMVARLDTQFQQAIKTGDVATVVKILHPQFKLVVGSGKVATYDEYVDELKAGSIKFEIQDEEPGSQSVMVAGDTAIVTAKLRIKGTKAGKAFDRTLWFSDTYVRTKNGWRYLFGQASLPLPAS